MKAVTTGNDLVSCVIIVIGLSLLAIIAIPLLTNVTLVLWHGSLTTRRLAMNGGIALACVLALVLGGYGWLCWNDAHVQAYTTTAEGNVIKGDSLTDEEYAMLKNRDIDPNGYYVITEHTDSAEFTDYDITQVDDAEGHIMHNYLLYLPADIILVGILICIVIFGPMKDEPCCQELRDRLGGPDWLTSEEAENHHDRHDYWLSGEIH